MKINTNEFFSITPVTTQVSNNKIFKHRKNKPTITLDKYSDEISEAFYACELELAKAAYAAINRAYTITERKENARVNERALAAQAEIRGLINLYRNNVKNEILPLAILKKHGEPYFDEEDKPTQDLRKLILGQFQVFCKKIIDFTPLLVPKDDIENLILVINTIYPDEYTRLVNYISYYEADPRYHSEEEWLNR